MSSEHVEIERKYLIENPDEIPFELTSYPFHTIEQAYLCTSPVVRIRRKDEDYYLTYKGKGLLSREEYNLPLTKEAYEHLKEKADGNIITKKRILIPHDDGLTIELDIFDGKFSGLVLAEIEFGDEESALNFTPPEWFSKDVTFSGEYQNSTLSRM